MMRVKRGLAFAVLPLFLAGCVSTAEIASYSDPKAGFSTVQAKAVSAAGKETVWIKSRAEADAIAARVRATIGKKTIDADTAVQIALLNNRGLQAVYAELGISAADVWQETMLVNPRIAIGGSALGAPNRTVEGTVVGNIMALATQRRRVDIAASRFRAAQFRAADETLRVAAAARRAWIKAASAWEHVAYLNKAQTAADAASELAKQLGESGAMPKGEQAREHAFYAELTGQIAKARLEARLAKEELTRQMGVWGQDLGYSVPNALPDLPKSIRSKPAIEAEALRSRVDLQAAKADLLALAQYHGLTQATRYLTDLELTGGVEVEREERKNLASGVAEAAFEIPIFDSGKARLRKAELEYMRAANILAQKAVNIRSEARSAEERYRSSYKIARHYRDNVLPLRTTVEEQSLLTYNGMITNTFELLADIRAKVDATQLSLDAKRAFWLADVDRNTAIHGGGARTPENGDAETASTESGSSAD
jgi:outer membrane protein TolC